MDLKFSKALKLIETPHLSGKHCLITRAWPQGAVSSKKVDQYEIPQEVP